MDTPETTTEVWYELEWSQAGAEDWFTYGSQADSVASIASRLQRARAVPQFDYRAVRKVLTTEVMPEA